MDTETIRKFEKRLGVQFHKPDLLTEALTRPAYVKEEKDKNPKASLKDNSRLSFLGDSVLELIVREYYFKKKIKTKGELSTICDKVVNEVYLASVAEELELIKCLNLSSNEASDDKGRGKILAESLEAIIGVLYIDQGLRKTKKIVRKIFSLP